MTEEIIIDGIDVSKCEVFFKANKTCYNCYACEGSDCYFKQLKRKEQENKESKEEQKELIKRITYFESVLQKAFNCLIRANAEGKITDTLWVTDLTTLWDIFATALRIENIEEYENEVLNDT
jgi:hypothetical protein